MKLSYKLALIFAFIFLLDGVIDALFFVYSFSLYGKNYVDLFHKMTSDAAPQLLGRAFILLLGFSIWYVFEKKNNRQKEQENENQSLDSIKQTINSFFLPTALINDKNEIVITNHAWIKVFYELEINLKSLSNLNFVEALKILTHSDDKIKDDILKISHEIVKGASPYYTFDFSFNLSGDIKWFKARINKFQLFNQNWMYLSLEPLNTGKLDINMDDIGTILTNAMLNSNSPIVVLNAGIIELSNDAFNQAMNYSPESLVETPLETLVNSSDKEKYKSLIDSQIGKEENIRFLSNQFTPFIAQVRSWTLEIKGVKKTILFFVDNTKLETLEAEFETFSMQIDEIYDRSCVSILVLNSDLKIERINDIATNFTGYSPSEAFQNIGIFDIAQAEFHSQINDIIHGKTSISMIEMNIETKNSVVKRTICSLFRLPNSESFVAMFIDLSSYDRTFQALIQKERILREIAENIDDLIWIESREKSQTTYASSKALTKWNLKDTRNDVLTTLTDKVANNDREAWMQAISNLRENAEMIDKQFVFTINDSARDIWVRTFPIISSSAYANTFDKTIGIAQDVTDRNELEKKAKNIEQNYQEIFNSVNDGIFIHDYQSGEIINANDYACKNLVETDLITLKNNWRLESQNVEYVKQIKEIIVNLETKDNFESQIFENQYLTFQGTQKYVEVKFKLANLEGIKRVIAIVRDISERKKIETKYNEREEFLNDVFSSITNPILVVRALNEGSDFVIAELNLEMEKFLAHDKLDLANRRLSEFSEEIFQNFITRFTQSYKKSGKMQWEQTREGANGAEHWLISITPIWKKNHSIEQLILACTSITLQKQAGEQIRNLNLDLENKIQTRTKELETTLQDLNSEILSRKQIEEELVVSQRELVSVLENEKRLSEMKTRFISMMSHEYRTPLTIIQTSTMLIEKFYQTRDDSGFAKYLSAMQSTIKDMSRTLDNVISAGKFDSGNISINYDMIDITNLFNKAIDEAKTLDKSKHNITSLDIGNIRVKTDYTLIKTITLNLLLNAVKYSPENSDIILKARLSENRFIFSVKDSGIGIDCSERERIFEQFYRSSRVMNSSVSGTGLGLNIVKTCVNALSGEINVESELGKGSEFIISLPL